MVASHQPIVATAIHDGHRLRPELQELTLLSDAQRLYEEDPCTGRIAEICDVHFVFEWSRFEVDLNRSREKSVYQTPEDCWGLTVWKEPLSEEIVNRSLEKYDRFYQEFQKCLEEMIALHERIIVLDLHSYNHRRKGPRGPVDDPELNPEINVGTGSMNREKWGPIVDSFIHDIKEYNFLGWTIDVRENVRFQGGYLSQWIHEQFPENACCLAIEVKKFYMTEWTGVVDDQQLHAVKNAIGFTLPGLVRTLDQMSMQR